MPFYRQIILLFTLNFLDAVFTLYWVRHGIATEGNHLMASLLEIGDFPFLLTKIAVGTAAAVVLWNWGHMKLAKFGLGLTLTIYVGLMRVHLFTGLSAAGVISENSVNQISLWFGSVLAFLF